MWGEAAHHVVWLMNRTWTKVVIGTMPDEAAFGKKPDISEVCEWGDKVWVRIEGGDKLGGRVVEGRWIGILDESKGVHVYWPVKKTVSTERNVYYDKTQSQVSRFEGEEWELIETKSHNPPVLSTPKRIPQVIPEAISENEEAISEPEIPTK